MSYTVYIRPSALQEIKNLPGYIRQRIKRSVSDLAQNPSPSNSKHLDFPGYNAWRLRVDRWRVIYQIITNGQIIEVLAIRKRPPYDYRDLEILLKNGNS